MRKLFLFGCVVLVAMVAVLACGGDADDDEASVDREVVVRTDDTLRFEPDEVRVRVGERVRLVADNREGLQLHDFSVERIAAGEVEVEGADHAHGDTSDYDLHVAAEAGERGVLVFVAQEPGEYQFFCSVVGHAEAGMTGTIIVEA
jgi:uncharacterized cupredoxin-like copper-binding protein